MMAAVEGSEQTNVRAAMVAALQAALAFAEDELEVRGDEDAEYDKPAAPLIEAINAALALAEAA